MESVRLSPFSRPRHRILAVVPSFLVLVFVGAALALHEVDHRFTVQGRLCGSDGLGIEGANVSVKNTRADITGAGKSDGDGDYKVVLHLHNENQGDPLLVKAGYYEANGRVELDSHDPKTERMVTIELGWPCRALPIWRQYWFFLSGIILAGVLVVLGTQKIAKRKSSGQKKGKSKKSPKA